MKAKSISLLTVAMLASITTSAVAAPGNKIMIPAPPPVAGAAPEGAPAVHQPAPAATKPVAPEFVGISPQFQHVSHWVKVQEYKDDLTMKPGMDKMALRMVVNNGVDGGAPGFSWFRVKMNGDVLFTQDALKGKKTGVVDVTGVIPAGSNQVVIEAAGVPGATISWQLATPPIKILSVEPKTVSPGDTVIVRGENFPSDVNQANVMVGESVGDVLGTTPKAMKIKVPDVVKGNSSSLSIEINGMPPVSYTFGVSGSAAPVVGGFSEWCAPVGAQVKLSGKFFSKIATQNQVFFGNVAGQVVTSDGESITVVVPSVPLPGNRGSVPVSVMTNGKKSRNTVAFMVGPRATDPNYVREVRQEVKVGSGVTTQNSSQASVQSSSSASMQSNSDARVTQWGTGDHVSESSSQSGGFSIVSPEDK
jgi:hypothetical protein